VNWEIVIGLETHAQLSTASKMFSGASTAFGAPPNTQASAVDIALPGVLPVANKGAVERAIRFGLAVGGTINKTSVFARKNYFYPDLPKAYQISQYELPIVQGGTISIFTKTGEKSIRLTRAHLEEDAGKSLHEDFHGMSGIDLNRAGTPLLEIVSEPEMRSAEEAVAYAKTLHSLVRWIGICDGNMQEGSFRCDANVSVRRPGAPLGTRCEIKNLNSFRFMEKAIEFEVKRQIALLEDGGKIVQETRLYDSDRDETRSMRTKEEAHDYRYFPDPDLPPLVVSEAWIESEREALPDLPQTMRERYELEYGLSKYDSALLTQSREMADFFEAVVSHEELRQLDRVRVAKTAANFITGGLSALLTKSEADLEASRIQPPALVGLVKLVLSERISVSAGKKLLEEIWNHGDESVGDLSSRVSPTDPNWNATVLYAIAQDKSVPSSNSTVAATVHAALGDLWLLPAENASQIEKVVDEVLAANAKQVEDYRGGKDKAFNSLVGQVMKATKGKANPAQVNEILKRKLAP
jgi:aspartyl-tRNA(Asn)/glutamyl-tRNA(Gln) amidotransferase subunit B